MHRAALAAAQALLAAEDLGHHPVRVAPLGDAVAVAAMGGGDVVLVVQMQADADRGRLLAGIEMDEAGDVACRELLVDGVLERADGPHLPVRLEQFVAAELHVGLPPLLAPWGWCSRNGTARQEMVWPRPERTNWHAAAA